MSKTNFIIAIIMGFVLDPTPILRVLSNPSNLMIVEFYTGTVAEYVGSLLAFAGISKLVSLIFYKCDKDVTFSVCLVIFGALFAFGRYGTN